MKASFENDPGRGPGYGLIRLKELEIPQDEPTFSLRRSGDQLCLAVQDWQEAEEHLRPDSFRFEDGGLVLAVSPAVVDKLDPLQIYRLTLFGAASPQRAMLELQNICYSPLAQGGAVAEVPVAARPVKSEPAPSVTELPVVEPVAEPPLTAQPLNMAQPVPRSSSGLWLAVAGLLLCLAIGGGVWWYMSSSQANQAELAKKVEETAQAEKAAAEKAAAEKAAQEKLAEEKAAAEKAEQEKAAAEKLAQEKVAAEKAAQEKAEQEKAAQEKLAQEKLAQEKAAQEKAAAEKAAADKAEQEKVAAEKPVRSAKEQVRDFLRGTGSPADALTLSKQLPTATSDDQDALFLLMEAAAEGGNAEAMLTVARFYNPADAGPSGSIIKDAEQALFWLTKAKDVPETAAEATKGLEALRGWLQSRAASDATAKALLDKMEK